MRLRLLGRVPGERDTGTRRIRSVAYGGAYVVWLPNGSSIWSVAPFEITH